MKIAVTSQGEDLEANVDLRFGRASSFLVVDTDTMSFEVVKNTQSLDLPQGAGIQSAQNIVPHGPEALLTGNCGPKAFKVLQAAGIAVVVGVEGRIRDVIAAYLRGEYEPVAEANVEGHWE
jgi:predicted Fe-Mo cluster-binding NifX family protein